MTHRWLGWGASKGCVLLEHVVWPRAQQDEDVDDAALRDPVSVRLRNLLIRLEVGQQFTQNVLEGERRRGKLGRGEGGGEREVMYKTVA